MSTENTNTVVAEEIPNLLITPTAQEYLSDLLDKQNTPGLAFVFC
jgi:Fe/S biogenesis protein NfuA